MRAGITIPRQSEARLSPDQTDKRPHGEQRQKHPGEATNPHQRYRFHELLAKQYAESTYCPKRSYRADQNRKRIVVSGCQVDRCDLREISPFASENDAK